MISIYNALGIEQTFEDKTQLEGLKQYIMDNVRHVIPGYSCDYYLHTFNHEIEFELCRATDGSDLGIAVHVSGHNMVSLAFDSIISDESNELSTRIFKMHHKNNSGSFPVRIVCPDVLACPENGDQIFGQIAAITDGNINVLNGESENAFSVVDSGENCVKVIGKITGITEYSFDYDNISAEYWDLDVETNIGTIAVVVRKDIASHVPEEGNIISTEAVLSLDVSIESKDFAEQAYTDDAYGEATFESEHRLVCGLIPNFKNAQRVLLNGIEIGNIGRFNRACCKTVNMCFNSESMYVENMDIAKRINSFLKNTPSDCEVVQIVSCSNPLYLGHKVISVKENGEIKTLIWISVNNAGFVDEIHFVDPSICKTGNDPELHALAMLGYGLCYCRANLLREYITQKCVYRSEYANWMSCGSKRIVDRMNKVSENIDDTAQYTFEIKHASEALRTTDDLPAIYRGEWCIEEYQFSKLASVIFIQINEDGQITNILLGRDGNYLKAFEQSGSSAAIRGVNPKNVKELLENFYGKVNTLKVMRENDTPDEDEAGAYVWKEADQYAQDWLSSNGYKIAKAEIEDDCIGYACSRRGKEYAVYFYAYGKQRQIQLDAEYCQRLKTYSLTEDRIILIVYLQVEIVDDDNGGKAYRVGNYSDSEDVAESWMLERANDKDILLFYPRAEVLDMVPRLMVAYNTQNLDLLKALLTSDAQLEQSTGGTFLNNGFYSYLSRIYQDHGKMKIAYIRYNDVIFSKVPYIEDYCYISFSVTQDKDKICQIKEHWLDDDYAELMITDEIPESNLLNEYPSINSIDFLTQSNEAEHSARLVFSNGEIRRYDFAAADPAIDKAEIDSEIFLIDHVCFTDKIFRHGKIVEHLPMPSWMGYSNYPERGQGLTFVNGYCISTAELYFNSYPIGEFSYAGLQDNVFIKQYGYSDDGYGVGTISDLDPANPLYLLNNTTLKAKTLPEKYQSTEFCVYPFCGGYSEGRVMVSLIGDIPLQYHHNRMGCAGMWGWLDTDMKEVIPPQYVYALNFVDGLAIVCKGQWNIEEEDGEKKYWCENEQWGVINTDGEEIVPCAFDELYEVDGTNRLFFVHEGGWENGNYAIFDTETQEIILKLDFDFDIGYMFNECFVADGDLLVFDEHIPGEGKDLITVYDIHEGKFLAYQEENTDRTFNGEKTLTVKNKQTGMDIIVF